MVNSIPIPQETSDLETAAVSDAAKPRTAVCVLGAWRSLDQSASSIRQYMLDPLDADAYAVIEPGRAPHGSKVRALAGPPGERPMSGGETHELPLPRGNSPIARKCTWLSGQGEFQEGQGA